MARWEFAFTIDRSRRVSIVQQIARAITSEIQRGRLRSGDRLPGSRTLARTLGVNRQTVVEAVDELAAEGWLISKPASGVYVAEGLPERQASGPLTSAGHSRRTPSRFGIPLGIAPVPELPPVVPAGTILMSSTRPDVRLVPVDILGRVHRRVLLRSGAELLSYCHPAGSVRLRRELAAMVSATRGLSVGRNGILVTRGSQMALTLVAQALVRPGDALAVEHPGYRPAWEAFRIAGADIVPVPVDEGGLQIAALRRLILRRPIRAVYITPHHQFPTTVTLTAPRRLELLRLAAQERFAVIEDDYDHEFHYTGRPVLPLASIDTAGVVIYIGTLSKVLAPALRIGFVVASDDLIEQLAAYRSFLDLQGDTVLESAIGEMLEEGQIQRHVRKMRRLYEARLKVLASGLRAQLADFLRFQEPSGGTAVWVRTEDASSMERWLRAAREHGVAIDDSKRFTVDAAALSGTRLGFASLDESQLRLAVKRLAAAAQAARPRRTAAKSWRRSK